VKRTVLDMDRYQWTVLFAAWLGWGFDVFDGLLFNFVAPNCVPTLLGIPLGTPEAKAETLKWAGYLTSVLLIGWAVGGVLFGRVADKIGRTKTLLLTMAMYSLGTALCAFAPNIWVLALCRVIASLGIGGEWAAGAAMVAEVVPEKRRVEAGALLYTSAPMGLFLATFVNFQISGVLFADDPSMSWRYVFLCGLIPAGAAFAVRLFVREPERWVANAGKTKPPEIRELFTPAVRRLTISGLSMAVIALITWWTVNAFLQVVSGGLGAVSAKELGMSPGETVLRVEGWKKIATNSFNLGGLIGTLLTVPVSKILGRKPMFGLYWAASSVSVLAAFGLDMAPETRLYMFFPIGLSVFGVFGSFTYYLPELFPTRLRGTGAGFCYNVGRVVAAIGPIVVGKVASMGADALGTAMRALFWVGLVPLVGILLLPLVIETKGKTLED